MRNATHARNKNSPERSARSCAALAATGITLALVCRGVLPQTLEPVALLDVSCALHQASACAKAPWFDEKEISPNRANLSTKSGLKKRFRESPGRQYNLFETTEGCSAAGTSKLMMTRKDGQRDGFETRCLSSTQFLEPFKVYARWWGRGFDFEYTPPTPSCAKQMLENVLLDKPGSCRRLVVTSEMLLAARREADRNLQRALYRQCALLMGDKADERCDKPIDGGK
jgi:hypothetical protein